MLRVELLSATVTVATGGGAGALTARGADPVCPSLVAMMLVEPAATAVTTPAELIVATLVFEEDQPMTRPVRTFPLASRVVAVALAVCPMLREELLSATETEVTGTGAGATTFKLPWPRTPSLVAEMTAVPGATAEIMPTSLTLATCELEVPQTMGRLARGAPSASLGVAVACSDCPAMIGEGKVMETIATGFRCTSTEVPPEEHAVVAITARPATARIVTRMTRPPLVV